MQLDRKQKVVLRFSESEDEETLERIGMKRKEVTNIVSDINTIN